MRVRLNKQDIKRIENAGYGDFLDKEGKNLKRINGYCKFLILDNGITSCRIQDLKPEICNGFPRGKGLFGKKVDIRCKACANKLYWLHKNQVKQVVLITLILGLQEYYQWWLFLQERLFLLLGQL